MREGIVGVYAAHAPRGEEDDAGPLRCHPVLDLGLAPEIHHAATGIEQESTGFAPEAAHHGPSYHAMLTGDPDELVGQIEAHAGI
jgi:hypothetical protein